MLAPVDMAHPAPWTGSEEWTDSSQSEGGWYKEG